MEIINRQRHGDGPASLSPTPKSVSSPSLSESAPGSVPSSHNHPSDPPFSSSTPSFPVSGFAPANSSPVRNPALFNSAPPISTPPSRMVAVNLKRDASSSSVSSSSSHASHASHTSHASQASRPSPRLPRPPSQESVHSNSSRGTRGASRGGRGLPPGRDAPLNFASRGGGAPPRGGVPLFPASRGGRGQPSPRGGMRGGGVTGASLPPGSSSPSINQQQPLPSRGPPPSSGVPLSGIPPQPGSSLPPPRSSGGSNEPPTEDTLSQRSRGGTRGGIPPPVRAQKGIPRGSSYPPRAAGIFLLILISSSFPFSLSFFFLSSFLPHTRPLFLSLPDTLSPWLVQSSWRQRRSLRK